MSESPRSAGVVDDVDDAGAIEVELLVAALDEDAAVRDQVARARSEAHGPDRRRCRGVPPKPTEQHDDERQADNERDERRRCPAACRPATDEAQACTPRATTASTAGRRAAARWPWSRARGRPSEPSARNESTRVRRPEHALALVEALGEEAVAVARRRGRRHAAHDGPDAVGRDEAVQHDGEPPPERARWAPRARARGRRCRGVRGCQWMRAKLISRVSIERRKRPRRMTMWRSVTRNSSWPRHHRGPNSSTSASVVIHAAKASRPPGRVESAVATDDGRGGGDRRGDARTPARRRGRRAGVETSFGRPDQRTGSPYSESRLTSGRPPDERCPRTLRLRVGAVKGRARKWRRACAANARRGRARGQRRMPRGVARLGASGVSAAL